MSVEDRILTDLEWQARGGTTIEQRDGVSRIVDPELRYNQDGFDHMADAARYWARYGRPFSTYNEYGTKQGGKTYGYYRRQSEPPQHPNCRCVVMPVEVSINQLTERMKQRWLK